MSIPQPLRTLACSTSTPLRYDACGQLISPGGFCHFRRTASYHVLILVLEGTLYFTANHIRHEVHAGEYLFLRSGEEHFGHSASEGKLSYLWVHIHEACRFDPETETQPEALYRFAEKGLAGDGVRVRKQFFQLLDMSLEEPSLPQVMMDYACSLLVMELTHAGSAEEERCRCPAVERAMEWIHKHYHRPFTVGELARSIGYQADYLSSLFKRSTGMSIVQYTLQLRLRMAKSLLTNYDISIKEAAYSCGFPDEKYFMRLFKRSEGITPSQFRSLQVK